MFKYINNDKLESLTPSLANADAEHAVAQLRNELIELKLLNVFVDIVQGFTVDRSQVRADEEPSIKHKRHTRIELRYHVEYPRPAACVYNVLVLPPDTLAYPFDVKLGGPKEQGEVRTVNNPEDLDEAFAAAMGDKALDFLAAARLMPHSGEDQEDPRAVSERLENGDLS